MQDRLTNIELLLMLSEDVKSQGDELSAEMTQRGAAHAHRVMELLNMLDRARFILEQERKRFSVYLPEDPRKPKLSEPPVNKIPEHLKSRAAE